MCIGLLLTRIIIFEKIVPIRQAMLLCPGGTLGGTPPSEDSMVICQGGGPIFFRTVGSGSRVSLLPSPSEPVASPHETPHIPFHTCAATNRPSLTCERPHIMRLSRKVPWHARAQIAL